MKHVISNDYLNNVQCICVKTCGRVSYCSIGERQFAVCIVVLEALRVCIALMVSDSSPFAFLCLMRFGEVSAFLVSDSSPFALPHLGALLLHISVSPIVYKITIS